VLVVLVAHLAPVALVPLVAWSVLLTSPAV
jgi:hypothetical protein